MHERALSDIRPRKKIKTKRKIRFALILYK